MGVTILVIFRDLCGLYNLRRARLVDKWCKFDWWMTELNDDRTWLFCKSNHIEQDTHIEPGHTPNRLNYSVTTWDKRMLSRKCWIGYVQKVRNSGRKWRNAKNEKMSVIRSPAFRMSKGQQIQLCLIHSSPRNYLQPLQYLIHTHKVYFYTMTDGI